MALLQSYKNQGKEEKKQRKKLHEKDDIRTKGKSYGIQCKDCRL